jgi:hypothetical protein
MTSTLLRFCSLLAGGLTLAGSLSAQPTPPPLQFPAASPGCTLKQRVGVTDIEVVYSRPSMKGRQIFGNVVPFGKVWRTGANAATKITFSTPVKLNGAAVAAGSYALYTIPGEDEWTIILNKGVGKSGTQYDEKDDVLRFKTAPVNWSETSLETFTIEFNELRDESAIMNLVWDHTVVPIKIEMDLTGKLVPQIEAVMASDAKQKPYFPAAVFYYDHGQDLQKAKQWIEAAVAQNEAYYTVYWKAKILAKLGEKDDAIAAAKRSKELAEKANDGAYMRLNDELLSSLQ